MRHHFASGLLVSALLAVCGLAAGCSSGGSASATASAEPAPAPAPMNAIFDDAGALAAPRYSTQLAMFGGSPEFGPAGNPEAAVGENARQVSFALEGGDFDPALSADGEMIYFASTAHAENADIYVKSVDGRSVTQLTTDPASDVMPAVSPDGTRVAFASNRNGTWDLYVMNSTGGQPVEITSDASQELSPTWSPDGRYIAYCRLGETSGRWEIWVSEVNRNAVKRFLTYGLFPDWHPTQNKIVFQRARDRGERLFSIWSLELVRGEATTLTELASSPIAALVNPTWSPDGSRIAFAAVMNPENAPPDLASAVQSDVWVMDDKGGSRTNVTGGRYANLMPAWGPDNTLYYVSDRTGVETIWSSDTTTSAVASAPVGGRTMTAQAKPAKPEPAEAQPVMATSARIPVVEVVPSDAHDHAEAAPEMANVPTPER